MENRFSEGVRKSVASNETSIIQPTSVAAATPVVASITIQIDEGWLDLASAGVTLLGAYITLLATVIAAVTTLRSRQPAYERSRRRRIDNEDRY